MTCCGCSAATGRRPSATGWSRNVLTHHISTERYRRFGQAPNNFADSLAAGVDTHLARELADPYDLDFLTLHPDHNERDLEDALVAQLTKFLAELGAGFSFVGPAVPAARRGQRLLRRPAVLPPRAVLLRRLRAQGRAS